MTVTDAEILDEMRRCNDPAWTVSEAAEWYDMNPDTMRRRLYQLDQEDKICCKQAGDRILVFWLPDDQRSVLSI
jgi:predicted transcriptional regulator